METGLQAIFAIYPIGDISGLVEYLKGDIKRRKAEI
jgi:hypothetical protein